MTMNQSIVEGAFEGFRMSQALSPDGEEILSRLARRLTGGGDLEANVRSLYDVEGADELALGLLWVLSKRKYSAEEVPLDPDEVGRVHAGMSTLLQSRGVLEGAAPSAMEEFQSPVEPDSTFSFTEQLPPQAEPDVFGAAVPEPSPLTESSSEPGAVGADPQSLGRTLEQFLESIQAGGDDRASILATLRGEIAGMRDSTEWGESFTRFIGAIDEFLAYISENDLLDDIRVMNFVTNFQEPYAHWMGTPEGEREGILEQATEVLGDFRAMFE